LFDDSIDPAAIGLAGSGARDSQRLLWARGREADFIVPVQIGTVNTDGHGPSLRYRLTLRVDGPPVAGPRPPGNTIQVIIDQSNRSFGIAKAKDLDLAGTRFIAFLREFQQNGTKQLHWHLARNGDDVVQAARKGAVLSEVGQD